MRRLETHPWWPKLVLVKDEKSLRELGKQFGVTPGAITAALRREGLTRTSAPSGPRAARRRTQTPSAPRVARTSSSSATPIVAEGTEAKPSASLVAQQRNSGVPKTHELKTWPESFLAIRRGRKTFEIRKDDRNFEVGDLLILREFNPDFEPPVNLSQGSYTGEIEVRRVSYKLEGGAWGLPDYLCVLSLAELHVGARNSRIRVRG